MEDSIDSIKFSKRELKCYSQEFEQITSKQKLPLSERELSLPSMTQFLKVIKINESYLAQILDMISENKTHLKFTNFMACMRLCSSLKQGNPLNRQDYLSEQKLISIKGGNRQAKLIEDIEEPKLKPEEPKQPEEIKMEAVTKNQKPQPTKLIPTVTDQKSKLAKLRNPHLKTQNKFKRKAGVSDNP